MNKKLFPILLTVFMLASCGGNSSSTTSTTSGGDDSKITFDQAVSLMLGLQREELLNSSSSKLISTTTTGQIRDVKEENFTNYKDYSSSSEGSYKRYVGELENLSDTFKTRRTAVVDKYRIEGQVASYDMFAEVTDYTKDVGSTYYKDSISKKFIVNSREEAEEAGLSSDSYILKGNYAAYAEANLTSSLFDFFASKIYENYYFQQLGMDKIEIQSINGKCNYTFDGSYSYDGDMNDVITEKMTMTFVTSGDSSRLLSFDCKSEYSDVSKANPEDAYYSTSSYIGTLEYSAKTDAPETGILNVNDYFLQKVNSIKLKARNSLFNDVDVDPTSIPVSYSYIFGFANSYSPAKAKDLNIIPKSSSNPEVVSLEKNSIGNSNFKIESQGSTTLTFTYYELKEGVYEESELTINVTITASQVESIGFMPKTNFYEHYGLLPGKTYTWETYCLPSKAIQDITAVSSDPSVLMVTVNADFSISLIPLKEGKATVTITSVATPSKSATMDYYVLDGEANYIDYLTTNHFFHDSPYGYTFDMDFKADGTGSRTMTIKDSNEVFVDTFRWSLVDNVLTFSKWSYVDQNSYTTGTIVRFLDKGDQFGIYCETPEKGQPFVIKNL